MSNHRKMVSRRHPFQIAQHHGHLQHFCKRRGGGGKPRKCPPYREKQSPISGKKDMEKKAPHRNRPYMEKRFPYGFFAVGGESIILPPPTHTLACVHAQNTSTY